MESIKSLWHTRMHHSTIINNIYSFYKNIINYNKLVHSIFHKYISGFLTFALHFYAPTPTHSEHSEADGSEGLVAMTSVVMSSSPYLLFTLASFCRTMNLPSVLDKFQGKKNKKIPNITFQTGPDLVCLHTTALPG